MMIDIFEATETEIIKGKRVVGGIREMVFKGTSLQKSPKDLVHSVMNIDNNIVLSLCNVVNITTRASILQHINVSK